WLLKRIYVQQILSFKKFSISNRTHPRPLSFEKERGERGEFDWRSHLHITTAIGSGFLPLTKSEILYKFKIPILKT
ncbi:MAG: hypothetical protein M1339_03505, partial [Bacteroidetes bacterium]|nr:hypothetical protein [Bacteroidota bacterium]